MADDEPHGLNDEADPDLLEADATTRLQCPNCCRLADVVRREMGLLFYECELCGTVGAVPESVTRQE